MASVSPDQLSKDQKDELCVSYAALMLHDDGLEINVSKANKNELITHKQVHNRYLFNLFSHVYRQRS